MHSYLSTAEEDAGFAVEMIAKCTKLKVLELARKRSRMEIRSGRIRRVAIPPQSLLNVLSKSTSLQTLSLERVQLSDMVSPP